MGPVLNEYGEKGLMVCKLGGWREVRGMLMLRGDGGLLILDRRDGWLGREAGRSAARGKIFPRNCEVLFHVEQW